MDRYSPGNDFIQPAILIFLHKNIQLNEILNVYKMWIFKICDGDINFLHPPPGYILHGTDDNSVRGRYSGPFGHGNHKKIVYFFDFFDFFRNI